MPDLPTSVAVSILASLVLYCLLGGADFGGGIWNLLCRGRRGAAQRELIDHAIGPVWETNHIWVIVAVVVLFTGFPPAFAALSTSLFIPVTLMLAGIVLRGAGFAFHYYNLHEGGGRGRWGTLFASASLLTPLLLGIVIGSVSSGFLRSPAPGYAGASWEWLSAFPLSVGVLTLAVFSYLAAVYLILETPDAELREDFRRRALWSAGTVALLLLLVLQMARKGAPEFYQALLKSRWSTGLVFLTAASGVASFAALLLRAYPIARVCAAAQTVLVLVGWGAAQHPYLIRPDITIATAASPPATLRLILVVLAAGALFLFPSIFLLFRIFKRDALFGSNRKPRPGV